MSTPDDDLSFRAFLLAYLCNHLPIIVIGFALGVVSLLITLINLWNFDSGSGVYIASLLSLPGLFGIVIASGYMIYRCNRVKSERDADLEEIL